MLLLEEGEQRVSRAPIDINLGEELKLNRFIRFFFDESLYLCVVFSGSELLYLLVSARLLSSKLVTGEGQHSDLRVLLCQLHQLAVVDVCLASPGGHIHDDQDLALVLGQTHSLAIDIRNFKLMNGGGGGGGTHVDTSYWSCLELLAWLAATTRLLI